MEKQVLEALKARRSIRKFKDEQIKQGELDAVLEAGTYAPTAGGKQQPVIVAVQDEETVARLGKMNDAVLGGTGKNPYYGAPTILIVFAPEESTTSLQNGSSVLAYLVVAAHAAGLGSCWIHRAEEMFETPEGKELMEKWGVPKNMKGIGNVALGYADESPAAKPRKDGYIIKIG